MSRINRRTLLIGGLTVAGAAGAVALPAGMALSGTTWSGITGSAASTALRYPFELGVASGDPQPDGMVLWTRLAPAPLNPDGYGGMPDAPVEVAWEIATDDKFSGVVKRGTATATRDWGHSVHVEVTGLQPGREYWYRFKAGSHLSPVGRTVTAPAATAMPSQLRFAFASCQHFETGWYQAHRQIAADRPDLVLFLGDYMYEKTATDGRDMVRRYLVTSEVDKLAEYRNRYAQHRTDPHLRAAHAAAPWLVVFDDHEIDNNWNSTNQTAARKAAAFKAFWENMPLRRAQRPNGAAISLFRRLQWGRLARFHMLDTRQYRSPQAKGEDPNLCKVVRSSARTLTGAPQEKWLLDGLVSHPSVWDLLGQQVFFAQRDKDGRKSTCNGNSTDGWDGYTASRDRIAKGWVDRKVPNPVVLTGDVHKHWAADLRLDYYDHSDPIIGSELVTSSVSSGGRGGAKPPDAAWFRANPHVKYNLDERGYVRVKLTRSQLTAEFMKVADVQNRKSAVSVARRYAIVAGERGLKRL